MQTRPLEKHLKEGLKAYNALSEEFKRANTLKYALFHNGELKGVHDDFNSACEAGYECSPEAEFFVKQIDEPPVHIRSLPRGVVTFEV